MTAEGTIHRFTVLCAAVAMVLGFGVAVGTASALTPIGSTSVDTSSSNAQLPAPAVAPGTPVLVSIAVSRGTASSVGGVGDVFWDSLTATSGSWTPTLSFGAGGGAAVATWYPAMTAPTEVLSGVSTYSASARNRITWTAPWAAAYVANLTLVSGGVRLSHSGSGWYESEKSYTANSAIPLGTLSAGSVTSSVAALSGPTASWSISFAPLPVAITEATGSAKVIRAGDDFRVEVKLTSQATIRYALQGPEARDFGVTDSERPGTTNSFLWQGFRPTGAPVKDGAYSFVVTATDPGGNVATASIPITVDSTGPRAVLRSKAVMPARNAAVVRVTDDFSKVSSVTFTIDRGTTVYGRPGLNTLRPSGGWTPGRHVIKVQAEDALGNTSVRTLRFKIQAKKRPPGSSSGAGGSGGSSGSSLPQM